MLRQLLVGAVLSVCNIAIHGLVMATVVQISSRMVGAKDAVRQSPRLTTFMIAFASIATVPVLMAAHFSEVMMWSLAYAIVGAAPAGAYTRPPARLSRQKRCAATARRRSLPQKARTSSS